MHYDQRVGREKFPYKMARYLCPNCSSRYGEPEAHGYMDVVVCEPCKAKRKLEFETPKLRKPEFDYRIGRTQ